MKHLLPFLLVLVSFCAQAQRSGTPTTPPPTTGPVIVPPPTEPTEPPAYAVAEPVSRYQHRADSLMASLNKSPITSGLLYDRVLALARLDVFGQRYANPDTSSVQHFLRAYGELRASSYTPDGRPARQLLADRAELSRQRDTLLLGVLRFRFHHIDPAALRDNLLRHETTDSSRLLDVAGRPHWPHWREFSVA